MKMATDEDSDECISAFSTSSSDEESTAEEDKDQRFSVSHHLPWLQQGNNQIEMQRSVQQRGAIVTDGDAILQNHPQAVVLQRITNVVKCQGAPKHLAVGNGNKIEENTRDERSRVQKIRDKTEKNIEQCSMTTVDTYGLSQVMDAIGNGSSLVIVTGSRGDGKTTIAKRAMSKLHEKGKQIFQIFTPDHLSDIGLNVGESVIMLDDICGKINFNENKWNVLEPALNSIFTGTDKKTIVLLVGNKSVIQEWSQCIEHLPVKHVSTVDLSQMNRTFQEKENILSGLEQMFNMKIDPQKRKQICEWDNHGFPKLCEMFLEMYKSDISSQVVSVFRLPTPFEEHEVMNVLKHRGKRMLLEKLIANQGELDIYREPCFETRYELIKTARNLDGIYLSETDCVYKFRLDYMYDLVATQFWELDRRFVIDKCKMTFINSTLQLQAEQPSGTAPKFLFVPERHYKYLVERFTTEICKGNIHLVLSHRACRWEPFVKLLMTSLLDNNNSSMQTVVSLTDATHKLTFAYLSASNGSFHILKNIVDNIEPITSELLREVLFGICDAASVDGLQYLKDKDIGFDINVRNHHGQTPIMVAANRRDRTFVTEVLAVNPDVNMFDSMGRTVLHYLCENGLTMAMKQIACDIAEIDRTDESGRTALFDACEYQHIDTVKELVKLKASIDVQSLHESCKLEEADILRLLLDTGAPVDAVLKDGDTLRHVKGAKR